MIGYYVKARVKADGTGIDLANGRMLMKPLDEIEVEEMICLTKLSVNIGLKQVAETILDASLAFEVASSTLPDHAEAVSAFVLGRYHFRPQLTRPRFWREP